MLQDVIPLHRSDDAHEGVAATSSSKLQRVANLPTQGALGVRDVLDGARVWHIWGTLGWHDIRQRYRRSKIGPFWLTISMGIMIAAIGGVYAGLFNMEIAHYLPSVAIGFVVWGFISGLTLDGCNAFIDGRGSIRHARLPLSIYVYRVVWRNLIIFGHNFLIVVVVALFFEIRPGWISLLAVPAVALLCLNGIWAGLLLGLLSARFRDVPQIVANAMQVAFFLTPILWKPDLLPGRAFVVTYNPFFYAVELVRAPLMGTTPPLKSWLAALVATLLGASVAFAVFVRYRRRIAYWI